MTTFTKEEVQNTLVRTYGWNGNNQGNGLSLTYSFANALPYWQGYDFQLSRVKQGTINGINAIRCAK